MARISGKKGSVSIAGVIVASLNKWGLNMAKDRTDVTCFGDTNKVSVQGLADIKGTVAGCYDFVSGSPAEGNSSLFDAADGDDSVELSLVPSTLAASNYWHGPAFLDASVDVDAKGAVTIGGSFVAAGAWARAGV